jgi:hypothetical protein
MKALVLTFDRNQVFADHMIFKFDQLWPQNPFQFHVPYQSLQRINRKRGLKYISSNSPIVETVLTLLSGIPDHEWVFWCMDDHFPLKLDVKWLEKMISHLERPGYDAVFGVNFCASYKKKRYWRNALLRQRNVKIIESETFVELLDYDQIWLPQFIRAGALRHFFSHMPEPTSGAKEMDQSKMKINKPKSHTLLLTGADHGIFAESSEQDRYTAAFLKSAQKFRFEIDQARLERGIITKDIRGKMGFRAGFERLLKRKNPL